MRPPVPVPGRGGFPNDHENMIDRELRMVGGTFSSRAGHENVRVGVRGRRAADAIDRLLKESSS